MPPRRHPGRPLNSRPSSPEERHLATDKNDGRQNRMVELVPHNKPPPGSAEALDEKAMFAKVWQSPKHRKAIKAMHEKAMATFHAQQRSGAGYEADKVLRHFQQEYNNRWITQGTKSFPSSFEVGEAFYTTRREYAGFFLLPERDYLVSFTDFLDFATSAAAPSSAIDKAYALEDRVTYNVSSLDKPDSLLLETDTSSSFAFVAATMVRRGDELSIMLVLGEQRPPEETDKMQVALNWSRMNPNKPHLQSVDLNDNEPLHLVDSELLRTLALVRFNLKEHRVETRMLMREMTKSFHVISDNELMFPPRAGSPPGTEPPLAERMDALGSVWEIAKTLVLLPSYLSARIDVVSTEDRLTQLGAELKSSMKAKRAVEQANPDSRVLHRRISAIRVVRAAPLLLEGRSYSAPAFQVPVEGFWRQFTDPTRQGHDESGAVIAGRTWVRAHIRHKDKEAPAEPKVVYIKASLSLARQRLERFRREGKPPGTGHNTSKQAGPLQSHVANAGLPVVSLAPSVVAPSESSSVAPATPAGAYLYVMRCPAHGRDIFKVGFTDRDPELRARELSSTTSAPMHFLVVQAWAVTEGQRAEKAAHEKLDRYRLASNREFFQAAYAELRSSIETAIAPWSIA